MSDYDPTEGMTDEQRERFFSRARMLINSLGDVSSKKDDFSSQDLEDSSLVILSLLRRVVYD